MNISLLHIMFFCVIYKSGKFESNSFSGKKVMHKKQAKNVRSVAKKRDTLQKALNSKHNREQH